MPRGDGTGPQGLGPGTGQRGGGGRSASGTSSSFQKSTFGGTLFALASMLFGTWLDKKLSKRETNKKSGQDDSN